MSTATLRARLAYNMSNMTLTARPRDVGVPETFGIETTRILALDYGRKRIGLALSDELGLTAQPLVTLLRTNRRNDLRRLRDICRKHSVARILVGHPLHMTGEPSPMAEEAALFAARLHKGPRHRSRTCGRAANLLGGSADHGRSKIFLATKTCSHRRRGRRRSVARLPRT